MGSRIQFWMHLYHGLHGADDQASAQEEENSDGKTKHGNRNDGGEDYRERYGEGLVEDVGFRDFLDMRFRGSGWESY